MKIDFSIDILYDFHGEIINAYNEF